MPKLDERFYRSMILAPASESKMLDSDFYVEGYATTVESPYLMWEYDGWKCYEVISRNAFDGADMSDVILQYDHRGKVYARQSNGSLMLAVDDHGLKVGADLSRSSGAKELYEEINAGLITRMSWCFVPDKTSTIDDEVNRTMTRRIEHVKKVYDVSAVSIPANDQTEISARGGWSDHPDGKEFAEAIQRREQIEIQRQTLLLRMNMLR